MSRTITARSLITTLLLLVGAASCGAQTLLTTVSTGSNPTAVALNATTNKIYVVNKNSNNVTVVDGATYNTTTVLTGAAPDAIAVNPVTNKIYVANGSANSVTVIDGATNRTTTVSGRRAPVGPTGPVDRA